MSVCIYRKIGEPKLHFSRPEHVFPAGIGGRRTLPIGYVSDEANSELSKIELAFMRRSEIYPLRLFLGPGKRGSRSPKKATQSEVHIIKQVEFGGKPNLGFVSLDVPHIINQARISPSDDYHIEMDPTTHKDQQKGMDAFLEQVKSWDGKAKLIIDPDMKDSVLLGCHKAKWYIAASTILLGDKAHCFADLVKRGTPSNNRRVSSSSSHFVTQIRLQVKTNEFYRVCAKIAFNFLSLEQGTAFVLQECFDPIRNWILRGGENQFAGSTGVNIDGLAPIADGTFPEYSHKVFLFSVGSELTSVVSFYGGYYATAVRLAKGIDSSIFSGLICDWRNAKEMTLMEYLANLRP